VFLGELAYFPCPTNIVSKEGRGVASLSWCSDRNPYFGFYLIESVCPIKEFGEVLPVRFGVTDFQNKPVGPKESEALHHGLKIPTAFSRESPRSQFQIKDPVRREKAHPIPKNPKGWEGCFSLLPFFKLWLSLKGSWGSLEGGLRGEEDEGKEDG
jgi:hypothetical protein